MVLIKSKARWRRRGTLHLHPCLQLSAGPHVDNGIYPILTAVVLGLPMECVFSLRRGRQVPGLAVSVPLKLTQMVTKLHSGCCSQSRGCCCGICYGRETPSCRLLDVGPRQMASLEMPKPPRSSLGHRGPGLFLGVLHNHSKFLKPSIHSESSPDTPRNVWDQHVSRVGLQGPSIALASFPLPAGAWVNLTAPPSSSSMVFHFEIEITIFSLNYILLFLYVQLHRVG